MGLAYKNVQRKENVRQGNRVLEKIMYGHAQNLEFEKAAAIRDDVAKLRLQQLSS